MKHFTHAITPGTLALMLTAVVTCLACCSSRSTDEGHTMAHEFRQAWPDSTRIAAQVAAVKIAIDTTENRDAFARAFVATVDSTADPAMMAAAHATVLSAADATAADASQVIATLQSGATGPKAYSQLQAVYRAYRMVGQEQLSEQLNETLDSQVAQMPVDRQMQVYAAATSPSLLGAAMCRERMKPGADTALISRQAEALRNIYDEAQYRKFAINYNINSNYNH